MNKKALLFMLAVAVQVLILISMPLSKAYTRATGRSVILKVAPVDPYTILSGYYVTLNYDISRTDNFTKVETSTSNQPDKASGEGSLGLGGNYNFSEGEALFAIVENKGDGLWQPIEIVKSLPSNLPANRIAIRGTWSGWRVNYDIEEFYIPEGKRDAIENDLREHAGQARVEVKVDSLGNAALVRLMIEDRIYE